MLLNIRNQFLVQLSPSQFNLIQWKIQVSFRLFASIYYDINSSPDILAMFAVDYITFQELFPLRYLFDIPFIIGISFMQNILLLESFFQCVQLTSIFKLEDQK
jgi:hypothetical protein